MKYLFLKYNNYYNRRIKIEYNLEDYQDAAEETDGEEPVKMYHAPTNNFNFDEGNDLLTEITFNWTKDWFPDYLVLYEGSWNDTNNIVSRWFIIKSVKNRKDQYIFTLKRDIIADDYTSLNKNVYNVLRCTVPDTNPLVFNKEQFTYNQIKKDEDFLYDETMCPWIVGYIPKETSFASKITVAEDYDIDKHTISHIDWDYYKYLGTGTVFGDIRIRDTRVPISYENNWWTGGYTGIQCHQSRTSNWTGDGTGIGLSNEGIRYSKSKYKSVKNAARDKWIDWTQVEKLIAEEHPEHNQDDIITQLLSYNGNKVLFSDGVYRISFFNYGNITHDNGVSDHTTGVNDSVTVYIKDCFQANYSGSVKHQDKFAYSYTTQVYSLAMTKIAEANTITYNIPVTGNNLTDAPYKMFCMPYPNATGDAPSVRTNNALNYKETIEKVYSSIISNSTTGTGTDNLYDIQLLPYCPMKFADRNYDQSEKTNYLTFPNNWKEGIDYTVIRITDSSGALLGQAGHIFFPKESSFTFTLDKVYNSGELKTLSSTFAVDNVKLDNETKFIRLCSPNYSGNYEMSPAKNGGLSTINVMCTYKPYNPFIEVQPAFGNLYGSNFNDSRGLICTGDFSLPIINSAWTQYELTNKTYQQTFNREIKHMEVSNDIARQNQLAQSISGSLTGGLTGATAGAMAGSMAGSMGTVVGGVIGGTIGTASSIAGGVADYKNLVKQQKEDLSYKKDLFNFSLQNIKALPDSLSKTSSINAVSKYVPFIETYDATDEEKELLKQYIEYNGMTAGFCGSITPAGYVQANIIKYNGMLDADELGELNNELLKGVYFE